MEYRIAAAPVFVVNYPVAGKFIVKTADITGTSPKIAIWLDGNLLIESNAQVNKTYTINVPAGMHRIKVDNTGTDWISIASYNFSGLGSAVDAYILASADKNKITGWILNNNYNHDYIKNNGQPLAASGAILTTEGLQDGIYQVKWYNCLTGAVITTESVNINNGKLNLLIPNTLWDVAFVLEGQTVGIATTKQAFPFKIYPNPVTTGQINLSFELTDHADVHITLLDAAGREVQECFKHKLHSGEQVVQINVSNNLAAGVYWVKIIAGQHIATQPLVIVKP
ncbi:MAG: T9SS type A sorting domain-containing protein [Saprospiraceae bacterium]|nr:T9SS type A sorting domain-containing protein [Saprospiraceae bacterium]